MLAAALQVLLVFQVFTLVRVLGWGWEALHWCI
jgi:hypothetical protein